MHDENDLTIGRTRRVLGERVLPAVYSARVPMQVAWHELPGEPVAPGDALRLDYRPHQVGTPWGAAWGTTWFHLTGQVPKQWRDRRVEAVIDLGFDVNMPGFQCEGLLYRADGGAVKSIHPRNQWALVAEHAEGGERVEYFLEGASNPVLLDYHPFLPTEQGDVQTASDRRLYATQAFDLALYDGQVHALALDLEVLLELQAELPAGPRRMQVLQALDDALDRLDLQHIGQTAAEARAVLAPVLSTPAHASVHTISAVGHAHIDSAWLWPVRETVRKVARTVSSMVDLIEQSDDFVFGMSSAQQYAWVKQHRPEVYARLQEAVAAGRFLPLGGMWVESDTVMPTGEALVRQFSQGQRFFAAEFGIRSRGVWLPDSFGYSPALPQLIRRAGFDWFFTQKISWNQVNKFPHHTFAWEGIDGSRIFSHFPSMDTYNSQLSGAEVARASRQFAENRKISGSIAPVGWGDGGGGTTREMLGKATRLADLEGSPQVRWEHPDDFFDRMLKAYPDPPVWVGELYLELHRGTLTSQHRTKQGNRRTEQLLLEAELWASTAAVRAGAAYPYEALDELWQQVLLLQFHDILPGTSIAWVHREAVADYVRVAARAEELIADAVAVLIGPGDQALELNPAPVGRDGVPALGVVPRRSRNADEAARADVLPDSGGVELSNDRLRVLVSAEGLITSAVELRTGREAIAAGRAGNLLQLHQDFPNLWDAWDVDRFYRNRVTDLRGVEVMTSGVDDDTAWVRVERRFNRSSVVQRLSLAPGSATVLIDQVTDWQETESILKLAFPLDVRASETCAETQFGYQRRPTHENTSWEAAKFETSMHRFVLVEEPGFGVALVNDSSYGFDVRRDVEGDQMTTTLRASLLRAPRFPDPRTDQGEHTHRFGLVIGADVQQATAEGLLLNAGPRHVSGGHGFEPLVAVDEELVVSSVKLADDRSGAVIVRVYEPAGRRARATLRLDFPVAEVRAVSLIEDQLDGPLVEVYADSVELALLPFEVRTLRIRVANASVG